MKLKHKGIILVLLPVAFEFVFVGALFYLLHQSQLEVNRAEKAREVIKHLNRIHRQLFVCIGGITPYAGAAELPNPVRNRLARRMLQDEFVHLRRCVRDDAVMTATVDEMERSMVEVETLSAEIKENLSMSGIAKVKNTLKRCRGLLDDLIVQLDVFSKQTEMIEEDSPLRQQDNRHQITLLLIAGFVANLAIAVGLAFYFNRGTVARLSIVLDNAQRLADGRPLHKPLTGDDEISGLDKVFLEMVKNLNDLASRERALLENAADVICSVDEQGTIADISPACTKVWSYEVEELVLKPLIAIVTAEDVAVTEEQFSAVRTSHAGRTFENRVLRKDGLLVDMLWSIKWSPVDNAFFCVAHDNTDRKTVERMKQEFVAMLSHDLRSPLNSVQAFFTMVQAKVYGSLNEKGMAKAAGLEATVSWLIEIISDLLDIDKIEAGQSDLNLVAVSLRRVVERASEALSDLAEDGKVRLVMPAGDAIVSIDEDSFMRVVTNLLSNAIKFSPEDSQVEVEILPSEEFVELRVVDHGSGIAPENQEAVFERFRQLSDAKPHKRRSSGLGLAVSKAIIEQHRGSIGLISKLGDGCIFWVRLSCIQAVPHRNDASVRNRR